MAEAVVTFVIEPSPERINPKDPESYLSTSPWQIMSFDAEQHYKSALIEEAFELHNIVLPEAIDLFSDGVTSHYRNKVEFSWFGDTTASGDTLDLAFYRRGSRGKIIVDNFSLLPEPMMKLAVSIRDQKVTAIIPLADFAYNDVPVINGRGFAVHVTSAADVDAFKKELSAEGSEISENFFNKWVDFETYRRIVFKDEHWTE
jgi:tRNA/tmRNA/rRNA uracil-C5-methylase (TrmA/RlmC/RlmD family)